ncbi:hypothetical protein [Tessaracoccus sp. OH4464_COT-324]|uniref:hypothetical protein n=1 Tax=Tessaracoccus sp. OH4464_COT-324 TaxID=2491059 RepID=UPI000F632733|nr:hypothetical protein [Tessaracoccus sp. OH4464_COT-324]RRD46358.1 hypothetical protein EII42_07565 [Tessaracoccus sp. OH4464_COT-324]
MSVILQLTGVSLPTTADLLSARASALNSALQVVNEVKQGVRGVGGSLLANNRGPTVDAFTRYFGTGIASPARLERFARELARAAEAARQAAAIIRQTRITMLAVAARAEIQLRRMLSAPAPEVMQRALIHRLVERTQRELHAVDNLGAAKAAQALSAAPVTLPGEAGSEDQNGYGGFKFGPPERPDIEWPEDYEYGVRMPTRADEDRWLAAGEQRRAFQYVPPGAAETLKYYDHFIANVGGEEQFDYESGARQDPALARNIESEVVRTAAAADRMVAEGGASFSITGVDNPTPHYPATEDWQKVIGGYRQWSSADVKVENGMVNMRVTVHAEDRYRFVRGDELRVGGGDAVNGRFQELGWAKPYNLRGQVTRELSWPVGHPPGEYSFDPNPQR